jgi:predicted DNA binding CopG/RHH family protein
MKKAKLPQTDSVQELAEFWDTHDLTDFQEELEEVTEPVFARDTQINIRLKPGEARTIREIAQSKGVALEELIREWVVQRLAGSNEDGDGKKAKVKRKK